MEPGCGEARRPSSQSTLHSVFRVSLHGRAACACVCDSCTWRTRRIAWGFGDLSRAPSFRPPCRIADSGLWWPYFIFSGERTGAIDPLPSVSSYFLWPSLACRALTHSACCLRKHLDTWSPPSTSRTFRIVWRVAVSSVSSTCLRRMPGGYGAWETPLPTSRRPRRRQSRTKSPGQSYTCTTPVWTTKSVSRACALSNSVEGSDDGAQANGSAGGARGGAQGAEISRRYRP